MKDALLSRAANKIYRTITGVNATATYKLQKEFLEFLHLINKGDSTLLASVPSTPDSEKLAELLNKHGSDKANSHNYHLLYSQIIDTTKPYRLLEIGIGSNNPDVPSNMGINGKPGASLRAFRDYSQNIEVYGADVDNRILFTEDRINTFYVDQCDRGSLESLSTRFAPGSLDLIIEDGIHISSASLLTFQVLSPLLKKGGHFVIEDSSHTYLPLWYAFQKTIPYKSTVYECTTRPGKGSVYIYDIEI